MTPALDGAEKNAQGAGRRIGQALGGAALAIGGALIGVGVAAVDAASEWEKAWLGVTAELDGTPDELQAVEDGLRELATSEVVGTMEDAAVQLAAIAEAAAAAGVTAPNMVKFVETMALLQMTTDIGGEKAVEMVTQYMRLRDLDPANVERFANTVAVIGDTSGRGAGAVLDLANQITTIGDRLGMSDANLIGFSGWLASLDIEGRKGRTAISELLDGIGAAVDTGGPKLTAFAETAGWSASQFSQSWRNEPLAALEDFVIGLGELDTAEQLKLLEDLELDGTATADVLLKMANAAGELGNSLDTSNEAWQTNNAMLEEAAGPAAGVEAMMTRLKNVWNELLLVIGEPLLGAVGDALTKVSELATEFTEAVKAGNELEAVKILLGGIGTGVTTVITGLADFVGGAVADLLGVDWPGAQAGVDAFFGAVRGLVDLGLNAVTTAVGNVVSAVTGWWDSAKVGVEKFVSGVTTKLQPVLDFINDILNAIRSIGPTAAETETILQGLDLETNGNTTGGQPTGPSGATYTPYTPTIDPLSQLELEMGRATGGPVFGGAPYIVGERGPELFIPGADGSIVPNNAMGGQVIIQAVYVQDSDPQRWLDRLSDAARMRGATTPMGVW
jgi:TP901 family phage tail tape measure protein